MNNTPATQGTTAVLTPIQGFKQLLNSTGITNRLGAMMSPQKMARFKSQLTQIVTGDQKLQACSPMSIISAAISAANVGLDISPSFGQAAVIPFNNTVEVWDEENHAIVKRKVSMAQLQIMTKGWTQLAMRSGKYEWINADSVYADEYQGSDLLSGMVYLKSISGGYRDQGRKDMIVGFFAAFRLTNGGQKVLYMTLKDIETHARTYSKSYVNYGKFPIPDAWKPNLSSTGLGWNKNWYAMARKTVLKLLIQRWGELSTEMEDAVASDQAAFKDIDSDPIYIDNNGEIVDDDTVKGYIVSESDSASTGEAAENVQEPAAEETMPEASSNAPVAQEEGNQGDIEKMFAAGARN